MSSTLDAIRKVFLRKRKLGDETILQVEAFEGGVKSIYVKAQSSDKALDLFKELKRELKTDVQNR